MILRRRDILFLNVFQQDDVENIQKGGEGLLKWNIGKHYVEGGTEQNIRAGIYKKGKKWKEKNSDMNYLQ